MSGAAVTGAIVAAHIKKMQEEEEEKLTTYNSNDMDGWEFKIMRSAMGRFGKTDYLKKVCDEEAKSGWELVEKFDSNRVRFKRRVNKRTSDQFAKNDPYRTSVGIDGQKTAMILVSIGIAIGLLVFLGIFLYNSGYDFRGITPTGIIASIILIILVVGVIVSIKKGRN